MKILSVIIGVEIARNLDNRKVHLLGSFRKTGKERGGET